MSATPEFERPRDAKLVIRQAPDGSPSVRLNDMELSGLLYGITVEDSGDEFDAWHVTMKFGAGNREASALELDFDVDTLRRLLADTEAKAASGE